MKRSLKLPENSCLDEKIQLFLTRKNFNHVKHNPNYKWLPSHQAFDFLPQSSKEFITYSLTFRMVCFELENGSFESLVTNTDFDAETLKSLYASRWGIETSFRALKYNLGLVSFHSKKVVGIHQEIFAHLTMYNFTRAVSSQRAQKISNRYVYHINFSDAAYACRLFLNDKIPIKQLFDYLSSHLVPTRQHRKHMRKIRYQTVVSFIFSFICRIV